MKTEKETIKFLKDRRSEIINDDRMGYPTATVFANAPLALIQMGMTAELRLIESALGMEYTKIPINNE